MWDTLREAVVPMTALQQYARDPYIDIDRFFQGRECREWCGGKRWRRHSGSNSWANSVRVLSVKMISVISRQTTYGPNPLARWMAAINTSTLIDLSRVPAFVAV